MSHGESTSPPRGAVSRRAAVLLVLTALLALVHASLVLLALLTPLYTLHGVVEGYVALMKYSLRYYSSEIHTPALDAVKILSTIPFMVSCLMLVSSMYAAASAFKRSLKHARLAYELLLGSILAAAVAAPLLFNLLRVVELEVSGLTVNNIFVSSAGFVNFGSTALSANTWVLALLKPLYTYTLLVAILASTLVLGRKLRII